MEPRVGAGFVTITALSLVLTACLGSTGPSPTDPHESTTTTAATTTTTVDVVSGLAEYQSCLVDQGVSVDRIRIDGLGRPRMAEALADLDLNDRAVLNALEACGGHLATGVLDLESDPELASLVRGRLEDFAECMRLEGVADYPDPVRGFDGVGSPFPIDRIPWSDQALPDAVDSCSRLLGA